MPYHESMERDYNAENFLLAKATKRGEPGAREKFIENNLGLAREAAHRYTRNGYGTYDDLYQLGIIGLIKGLDNYDPDLGYKVSTYVCDWIDQEIERGSTSPGALTVSVRAGQYANRVQRALTKIGENATIEEIMEETGLSRSHAEMGQAALIGRTAAADINAFVDSELAGVTRDSHEDWVEQEKVRRAFDQLCLKDKKLLELTEGLGNDEERSVQEAAWKLGIHRDTAAKRVREARYQLRVALEAEGVTGE